MSGMWDGKYSMVLYEYVVSCEGKRRLTMTTDSSAPILASPRSHLHFYVYVVQ